VPCPTRRSPVHRAPPPRGPLAIPRSPSRAASAWAIASLAALAACGGADEPSAELAAGAVPRAALRDPPRSELRVLARRELRVPGKPTGLLAGDLDGDGHDDLCAATREPGGLVLWRGTAQGLSAAPERTALGDWPLGPHVLGAGQSARIALASWIPAELCLVDPRAQPPSALVRTPLEGVPCALATRAQAGLAPGTPAIAVATRADRLLVFDAQGTLLGQRALGGRRATCALFLEDGALALGYQLDERLEILAPEALLADGEPLVRHALGGIPRALALADVDGDGTRELVVAGGARAAWIFGHGASASAQPRYSGAAMNVPAPGLVPVGLAAADLDGDRAAELVFASQGDTGYGLLARIAADGQRIALTEYGGQSPWAVALGRFDSQAPLDLAIANRDASCISLLSGVGRVEAERAAFVQAARCAVGANPVAIASGAAAGRAMAFALNAGQGTLSVLAAENGALAERARVALGPAPRGLATADLDGDGTSELATLVSDAQGARALLLAPGARGYADARRRELPLGASASAIAFTSLARKGPAGLIALDREGGAWSWLAARAPAELEYEAALRHALVPGPLAVAALGFDKDGARELAFALDAPLGRGALVLVRASAREAQAPQTIPLHALTALDGHRPIELASGDFDGDGAADLALLSGSGQASAPGQLNVLLRRDADWLPLPPFATGMAPSALLALDLDRDGRDDLAVCAQNSHALNLWLARPSTAAQGQLAFARQADAGAGLGPLALCALDLDGDGAPDLAVANAFSDDVSAILVRAPSE